MTATIPRAEINAVGHRHGVDYNLDADPTAEWVRGVAMGLRNAYASGHGGFAPAEILVEADDLDALADLHERKAK